MDPPELFSSESNGSTAESTNGRPRKDREESFTMIDFPGMMSRSAAESSSEGDPSNAREERIAIEIAVRDVLGRSGDDSNSGGPRNEMEEGFAIRNLPEMTIGVRSAASYPAADCKDGGEAAAESNNGEQRKEREKKPFARRDCPPGMRILGAIPMPSRRNTGPKKAIAKKRTGKSKADQIAHLPSDCDCQSVDTQASTNRRLVKPFKKETNGVVMDAKKLQTVPSFLVSSR